MALVQGHCESRFEALKIALEANLSSGEELGAAIALDLDGQVAVDTWRTRHS
jgi:hypothetical protein